MNPAPLPSILSAYDDEPPALRDALAQATRALDVGAFVRCAEWLGYAADIARPTSVRRACELDEAAERVLDLGRRQSTVVRAVPTPPPFPAPGRLPFLDEDDEEPIPLLTRLEPAVPADDDEPTQIRRLWGPVIEDPESDISMTSVRVAVLADASTGCLVCRPLATGETVPEGVTAMLVAPTTFDAQRLATLLAQLS